MRTKLVTCLAAAALALAACGSDSDSDSDEAATDDSAAQDAAGQVGQAVGSLVGTGDTDLGEVLTTEDGLTLYAFTPDEGGTPTCVDACADAWPPVTVEGAELPEGLDAEVFSVAERPDGTYQLAANDWPLYSYAGDAAPGDVNGQGSGESWYAVGPDGTLVRDGAPATEAPASTEAPATTESGDDYGY